MNQFEAAQHLDEIERLGRRQGLVGAKPADSMGAAVEVIGGRLLIDPDPYTTELAARDEYRILYVSADGLLHRDVSATPDDEIVALLRLESVRLRLVALSVSPLRAR